MISVKEKACFGKKWDDDEIDQLLKEIHKGMTHEEIARIHFRTVGGIRSRIWSIAGDYYEEGRTMEEIQRFTKLPHDEVANAIESRKFRSQLKKEKEEAKAQAQESKPIKAPIKKDLQKDIMNRLDEIYILLKTIQSTSETKIHTVPQSVLE